MSVQIIDIPKPNCPKAESPTNKGWLSNRSRRTEAHPKQSLFGSSLQMRDEKMIEELKSIDLTAYDQEMKMRGQKNQKLSPELQAIFGPGPQKLLRQREEMLRHNRQQLQAREAQIKRAKKMLSSLEERSKYFQVQPVARPPSGSQDQSKSVRWISERDLDHSSEINSVGLKNGSYNHHKYGNRPPVHQYNLIGDIFSKGMDFQDVTDKPNHVVPPMFPYKRHKDPYAVPKESYIKNTVGKSKTIAGTSLVMPPNIQHQFGSNVCAVLLGDPEKVRQTLEKQHESQRVAARLYQPSTRTELPPENLDPTYAQLGTSTRSNLFGPSVTYGHKISKTKQDFSDEIHKRRVAETDKYRYQRDELSTWAEQNVLRERVKKAWDGYRGLWWQGHTIRGRLKKTWDEFEESRPKPKVNWNRNAKRAPPPPKPKEPKGKPKTMPKPKDPSPPPKSDMVIEDIEFKTPPLTPPAVLLPPPPVKVAPDEDDDFWDFYGQGLPLP